MKRIIEKQKTEEATGLAENPSGIGKIYSDTGAEVSVEFAPELIRRGMPIVIPNAGAGSYNHVFLNVLNYDEIKVVNWSSSAGDWTFGVREGEVWRIAVQDNRYPYHGFRYSINEHDEFESFESLTQFE